MSAAGHLIGQRVTLRLDGHLPHVIAAGCLAQTPARTIGPGRRARLAGARIADNPLPPPPAQPPRAQRRVPVNGEIIRGMKTFSVTATGFRARSGCG
ncbi:hypothetical protein [Phytohabitans houttuyneae]|uniref:hypothetical protein n=1 Tax=Phytohabitans houttuyneae TaxID=1076126 RepID=UPI00156440E9|nr:hypothetical protein [Phytohabitans houttuyneae]